MDVHEIRGEVRGGSRLSISISDPNLWPTSVLRGRGVFSASLDVVAAVRDAVVRQAASWGVARIRVPSMSDAWLRMHETEYDKHRSDLLC
jgi:hypothetical protein